MTNSRLEAPIKKTSIEEELSIYELRILYAVSWAQRVAIAAESAESDLLAMLALNTRPHFFTKGPGFVVSPRQVGVCFSTLAVLNMLRSGKQSENLVASL